MRIRRIPCASRKWRSATTATTSKYAHQIPKASTRPSSAAAIVPASRTPCRPVPIATIDSPRAMITISEKRSAK